MSDVNDTNVSMGDRFPAYDASAIESKWQRVWAEKGTYKTDEDPKKPKK